MPNSLDWPPGYYALPLSVYGCPASVNNNWGLGYVNISFKHEIRLYENQLGIVGWNAAFLLQSGPYGPYSYQMNFCTMSSNTSAVSTRWPVGRYSIFSADRVRRTCPEGNYYISQSADTTTKREIKKESLTKGLMIQNVCNKITGEEIELTTLLGF